MAEPIEEMDPRAAIFFQRSYRAVDGLWFMKVEERLGFGAALDVDAEVWRVLPKIQARLLKEMLGTDDGLMALKKCLCTKLIWEGHSLDPSVSEDGHTLEISISECPWHALMVKSGREHLSGQVGRRICSQEYAIWAGEFGPGITFSLAEQECEGAPACRLVFQATRGESDDATG